VGSVGYYWGIRSLFLGALRVTLGIVSY
jgi:hypothetical protein